MKIVLFGKNGQVGHAIQQTLLPLGSLIALGRQEVDLENFSHLHNELYQHKPNIIVNAAAYTAVDKAENDELKAYAINAKAVEIMARYAYDTNALLIHYSTDYVFDGEKSEAYVETDITNPQNVYGRSKRAGEEAILASNCQAFIFRTSWVFSSHGNNFIKTILSFARERESLRVVSDQFGAPTSAELIAKVTKKAIERYQKNILKASLYHLSSSGETTWFDLACYVVQHTNMNGIALKLKPEQISPISTESYPLPAKRPKNSRLNTEMLSNCLELNFPDWRIEVQQVIKSLY